MCRIHQGFRLCTCQEELANPDWILERRNQQVPVAIAIGSVARPEPLSKAEALDRRTLLDGLNHSDPFDFEYTATIGDVLKVYVGARWLEFRYEKPLLRSPRWRFTEESGLAHWRQQMEPLHAGQLKP